MPEAIATCVLTNTLSLELRKIDYGGDEVLITENGKNPQWYDTYLIYNETSEEKEIGIFYGKLPVPLSEFIRI